MSTQQEARPPAEVSVTLPKQRGTSKSAPLSSHLEIKNGLLAALINEEYRHLLPQLERVRLSSGEVIYEAEEKIRYVYFPETAVVSLLSTLANGATTEVGLIGREGMVGLTVFLGGSITQYQAVVQISGDAVRMQASGLREELRVGSPLQLLLLRYTRALLALISQSVVCTQHHSLDRRFSRWLLMMHDYVESNEMRLTQELIASMLGSRRAGVTVVAGALRDAGLIRYSRGYITIVDRQGLEAAACECYAIIREEFDRLSASPARKRSTSISPSNRSGLAADH